MKFVQVCATFSMADIFRLVSSFLSASLSLFLFLHVLETYALTNRINRVQSNLHLQRKFFTIRQQILLKSIATFLFFHFSMMSKEVMRSWLHLTSQLLVAAVLATSQLEAVSFASSESFHQRPDKCHSSGCFPPFGNLLVGRSSKLTATSTYGGHVIGHIIKYSNDVKGDNSTTRMSSSSSAAASSVTSSSSSDTRNLSHKWWQSTPGQERVTIRLDLENVMQLSNISILFRENMPSALLVETSRDFGRSWRLFNYYSSNCDNEYPGVPSAVGDVRGKISCINYTVYNETSATSSPDASKFNEGSPASVGDKLWLNIDSPVIRLVTNLRVNLTRFSPKVNWYSIEEMYVKGSCNCNGHASLCIPDANEDSAIVPGMVHSACLCQHNTRGNSCEMCHDLYNDRPWEPGSANNKNECQKCNCHDRASSCVYDVSVSGGICVACINSKGLNCERCRSFFYGQANETCTPCECDALGSSDNLCDGQTGQCSCLSSKKGRKCDVDV